MNNERDCKHGQLARSCEICGLEAENAALNAELAAMRDQNPFAWYDPSADKFTRDLDDPGMNRGAILWRLFLDAQPSAERPCSTLPPLAALLRDVAWLHAKELENAGVVQWQDVSSEGESKNITLFATPT